MAAASLKVQKFWAGLEPVRVPLYDRSAHKHALDDFVRQLFEQVYEYTEDQGTSNIKLVLGYIGCIAALGGSAYAYFLPFEQTRVFLAVCVVVYFVCSSAMSWVAHKEGGRVFQGSSKIASGRRLIDVSAEWPAGTSQYTYRASGTQGTKHGESSVSFDLGQVFDSSGLLLTSVVHEHIAKLIAAVYADSKKN